MKTVKFSLLMTVLMMGATTVFAQGWRFADRPGYGNGYGPGTCVNVLPGLTDDQKVKITDLQINHQKEMVEWRFKQRSAFDPVERNEIRGEMLKKIQSHREEVKNMLTEDQQKQLDLWQARGLNGGRGFAPGCRVPRGRAGFPGRGGRGFCGGW